MKKPPHVLATVTAGCLLLFLTNPTPAPGAVAGPTPARAALWIDALCGEPLTFNDLLYELQSARAIYVGEYHSIPRHHELETQILEGLAQRGTNLVLAMEQFDFTAQPALDQFNSGALDLSGLIRQCDWGKQWPSHTNYHALLLAARRQSIPLLALNARAETIRAIARHGLGGLPAQARSELPENVVTGDPLYERLLNRELSVHMAFDPAKLHPIFEAQVARDETMADRLAAFLRSPAGQGRTALVLCGRGHCEFGLGTPERVARRIPGISQRIVLLSESGDLQLSEQERRQSRQVEISHQFLRDLGRAPADFFQVTQPAEPAPEPRR